jgi:hypothetical protein
LPVSRTAQAKAAVHLFCFCLFFMNLSLTFDALLPDARKQPFLFTIAQTGTRAGRARQKLKVRIQTRTSPFVLI